MIAALLCTYDCFHVRDTVCFDGPLIMCPSSPGCELVKGMPMSDMESCLEHDDGRRTKRSNFLGLEGMTKPLFTNGTHSSQRLAYSHPSGKTLHLVYDVEHAKAHVLNVDAEEAVRTVRCTATSMTIRMVNTSAATASAATLRSSHGAYITGARGWTRCDDGNEGEEHILRRVVGSSSQGALIFIQTRPAAHVELFKRAHLRFSVSHFPGDHFTTYGHHTPVETAARPAFIGVGRRTEQQVGGWFGSFCNFVWHGVQTIAHSVAKVVQTAAKVIKKIVTGDFKYAHTWKYNHVGWNIDSSGHVIQDDIDFGLNCTKIDLECSAHCTNCYFDLAPSLEFHLDIEGYSIKKIMLAVKGEVSYSSELTTEWHGDMDMDKEHAVAHIDGSPIYFEIGPVPFSVELDAVVHLGIAVKAFTNGTGSAMASATGDVHYGFVYTPDDGLHLIHEKKFDYHNHPPTFSGKAQISTQVYIQPVLLLSVDHIGGPNVGVKGFLELVVMYKGSLSSCSKSGWDAGLGYALNWGFQATLGVELKVSIEDHVLVDKTCHPLPAVTHKWPLVSGCVDIAKSRAASSVGVKCVASHRSCERLVSSSADDVLYQMVPLAQVTSPFAGVTYTGLVQSSSAPGCEPFSIGFSLQATDANSAVWTGATHGMIQKTASVNDYNVDCLYQTKYTGDNLHDLSFQLVFQAYGYVQYINCTENGYIPPVVSGAAVYSTDHSSLHITPQSTCIQPFTLVRSVALLANAVSHAASASPSVALASKAVLKACNCWDIYSFECVKECNDQNGPEIEDSDNEETRINECMSRLRNTSVCEKVRASSFEEPKGSLTYYCHFQPGEPYRPPECQNNCDWCPGAPPPPAPPGPVQGEACIWDCGTWTNQVCSHNLGFCDPVEARCFSSGRSDQPKLLMKLPMSLKECLQEYDCVQAKPAPIDATHGAHPNCCNNYPHKCINGSSIPAVQA